MDEDPSSTGLEGRITGVRFELATCHEICSVSNSDFSISHSSQLSNPFLGLPLESGKCESCGASEPGLCEGHFGYIELPIPIYHPCHVDELRRMLGMLCLRCLKIKNRKFQGKNVGIAEKILASCCQEASLISVNEVKTTDGACCLELKVPARSGLQDGFWHFLEKYGFRYGDSRMHRRPLLPSEVMIILKNIPAETRKKLAGKGYFPQEGYVLQCLPVPPNCLSLPDVSDGSTVMSSDHSQTMLKKVLKQVEIIKSSRSGTPNFESHEVEANELQAAVAQYFQFRGTSKASRNVEIRLGISKEANDSSTKAWLEKMKTLFIRKASGFSSRSVITGDPYRGVDEIGLPAEVAQRITFEERVSEHNIRYLQKLVDEKLCLTYRDGLSTYSLREGSKGHTFLRPGQVVHRKIMDGDIVFINRPPTTHKHSLQALSVYTHDDHTVKINPLICGPLSADFDGDCVHLFYPQSLAAKAEVLGLFSVDKQLLSSHTGNFNLQLANDSLLSLRISFKKVFFTKAAIQQLAMYVANDLPSPALTSPKSGPLWTASQLLQIALPSVFDSCGERHLINKSEVLKIDTDGDRMPSIINDIVTSIFFGKGPKDVLKFFNSLQPLLMENLYCEGSSVHLKDFFIPRDTTATIQSDIQNLSGLLYHLRSSYNEMLESQLENHLRLLRVPVAAFILKASNLGSLIDSKSESAIGKVVQQIGFLGLQLSDKRKFYSPVLVSDMESLFERRYPFGAKYPCEKFGFVTKCLFRGLDPYQEMVHSIASREVIVRSTRGLTEPGTLFKNLMAILRDVVICYDGTVRNVSSNSIIQFEYGVNIGNNAPSFFPAGEPVGVLAATAMSNPAYKAVLDSSPSSNSSWEMMKEILLCGVKFKNNVSDRRILLYLNDCCCGKKYCRENAAYLVKNHLKKVSLKDAAVEFLIEYNGNQTPYGSSEIDAGLVGHIHLDKTKMKDSKISMSDIVEKCKDTINSFGKKKKIGHLFKRVSLSSSDSCSFGRTCGSKWFDMPCLKFFWQEARDIHLERTSHIFADTICPVLLETIVKGDPRVASANIIWISPETTNWIRNPFKNQIGVLALDVVLEKDAIKQSGDSWRTILDSCLPVIHLIDTSRSIPYSIKQVQELLGISCAFEQAIQRLSTSVNMVTKGVLKEHLILLASSMTCSGDLIGFNAGGIKALSRSLKVQMPFTEATLFTPKKCFERAAEKCHVDALSSIVASCSWGKHVSVGTGSPFDLFWDTREMNLSKGNEISVYDFLYMVRNTSGEISTGGLGTEIDDMEWDFENTEFAVSPEHEMGKATFEDDAEVDYILKNKNLEGFQTNYQSWVNVPSSNVKSCNSWSNWSAEAQSSKSVDKSGSWASWGNKGEAAAGTSWGTSGNHLPVKENENTEVHASKWSNGLDASGAWAQWDKKVEAAAASGWGTSGGHLPPKENENTEDHASKCGKGIDGSRSWGSWNKQVQAAAATSWGTGGGDIPVKKTGKIEDHASESSKGLGGSDSWASSSWGKKVEAAAATSWGTSGGHLSVKENENTEYNASLSRCGKYIDGSGSWGSRNKKVEAAAGTRWGTDACDIPVKKTENIKGHASESSKGFGGSDSWPSSWGKKVEAAAATSWGTSGGQLSVKENENTEDNASKSWKGIDGYMSWGSWTKRNEAAAATSWGTGGGDLPVKTTEKVEDHAFKSSKGFGRSESWSSWGKKVEAAPATSWGTSGDHLPVKEDNNEEDHVSQSSKGLGASDSLASSWDKHVEKVDGANWGKNDRHLVQENENLEEHATKSNNGHDGSGSWGSWGKKSEISVTTSCSESDGNLPVQKIDDTEDGATHLHNGLDGSSSSASWGQNIKKSITTGWSKNNHPLPVQENSWDGQKAGGSNGSPWSQQRRSGARRDDSSRGWGSSNSGDWKNRRNHAAKPVGGSNEDSNASGIFTATRQRLDMFTADEQDILSDVEPIMQHIRKVMQRYNDGDPLTADDQSYIVDNVVNYHPDKASKVGSGIDHIMVSRHSSFQDSRCFYIVSSDGRKEDFSYRKCLENFVKEKHADKAEAFVGKYFRRPQPRPGWRREQQSREQSVAPEEGRTKDRTLR